MKLLLLGATGRVGGHILSQALEDGLQVTVLVRTPEKLAASGEQLTIMQGDVLQRDAMMQAAQGADAIISALGTDGADVLTQSAPILLEAMRANGIRRIITIGTAGILNSRTEPGLLRYQSSESRRTLTRAASEHHQFYLTLAASSLDWTIVCPTYLPDGEFTGVYRVERDMLPVDGKQISVPDTAAFAYAQLTSEAYMGCRVGIAY